MSLIIETLTNHIYQQLMNFPFHNLNLLNGTNASIGGTCFDHALRLKQSLQLDGFTAKLHEAEVCMTGEKTHRLVRVDAEGDIIYLDTGTGWPTGYVIPLDGAEKNYEIAGIKFKSILHERHILVQRYNGNNWLNMNRIPIEEQDEVSILDKFNDRYSKDLPFSNELRLCWFDGQKFNRIAGNQLSIYRERKNVEHINITLAEILKIIEKTTFSELMPDLEKYAEKYC